MIEQEDGTGFTHKPVSELMIQLLRGQVRKRIKKPRHNAGDPLQAASAQEQHQHTSQRYLQVVIWPHANGFSAISSISPLLAQTAKQVRRHESKPHAAFKAAAFTTCCTAPCDCDSLPQPSLKGNRNGRGGRQARRREDQGASIQAFLRKHL